MASPTRPYLVVVRAGDRSLHREWLRGRRNFDLVVDYYGSTPGLWREDADVYLERKGPKFAPVGEWLQDNAALVREYEAVWLPDDDLYATGDTVSDMLELTTALGLGAAQPALTGDSYFSHGITLQVAGLAMRWTSFVEVMGPVFSRAGLQACLPSFGRSVSGWGLDTIWPTMLAAAGLEVGILDATPVRHTRPVGGGTLYGTLTKSPEEEAVELAAEYGVSWPLQHRVLGALDPSGRLLDALELANALLGGSSPRVLQSAAEQYVYLAPTVNTLLEAAGVRV
ncbi:hypothetical protein CLV35_0590 [Motilibacter peucedani]|uniref:DUF707 domain-containing protein n=1 Tax=Motilibacter peucedani TaxID=598650 RepID=A0A420XU37_9ACTN|nr:hypothetical protein [Motilibacter peucedani]RKS80169.1 hypothetical protein CLV35_0590 [Motilibacter peucedani]